MKHLLLTLTLLLIAPALQAEEIQFGTNLTLQVPDSLKWTGSKGTIEGSIPGHLYLLGKWLSHSGHDVGKMEAYGDSILFPGLKDARRISVTTEPWHDWTHDYRITTYRMPNADSTLVHVYQINANGCRYYFSFIPLSPQGEQTAQQIMHTGFDNHMWIGNAAAWWAMLAMAIIITSIIIVGEGGDGDDPLTPRSYIKSVTITMIIALTVITAVTWGHWGYWLRAMGCATALSLLVPPLRRPVIWLLDQCS